ncbi:helix-turn-helix domain-containing protein [Caballeronia sp. HLA56]
MATRLRIERKRLGDSQRSLANKAGVTEKTQAMYENGHRFPDSRYLQLVAQSGVDVLYVLTGMRSEQTLTSEELILVHSYRRLAPHIRRAVVLFVRSL